MSETENLKKVIFNMLNFTNMYCLVLDPNMIIKFLNVSLVKDLEYNSYKDLIGKCWLDFIEESNKEMIKTVHTSIVNGVEDWEYKYREVKNNILTRSGDTIPVYWFNSHTNSEIDWTFSFGIKKLYDKMDDIRFFYHDVIMKDRIMINSIRDAMEMENKNGVLYGK